jgi:hypothetical protein
MHAWASRAEREARMSRFWPLKVPGSPGCWLSSRIRQGAQIGHLSQVSQVSQLLRIKKERRGRSLGRPNGKD